MLVNALEYAPGQLSLLSSAGHEMNTDRVRDALWLLSKCRMAQRYLICIFYMQPFVDARVGG